MKNADVRRVAAVYNPTSGGGHFRKDVPLIVESLRGFGMAVEEFATEGPGHATYLARRAVTQGFDLVCCIGGDGTVNEAINGVAETDVPLAIIPTGTVNVLALELGIPTYRFVKRYLERRPTQLGLKQVDPLIRQLTEYRDLIERITTKENT